MQPPVWKGTKHTVNGDIYYLVSICTFTKVGATAKSAKGLGILFASKRGTNRDY